MSGRASGEGCSPSKQYKIHLQYGDVSREMGLNGFGFEWKVQSQHSELKVARCPYSVFY
jgi:hypothetical protein